MFITIQQIQTGGKNLFEIKSNNQILYRAYTPHLDIKLLFNTENLHKLIFMDTDGNEIFHTTYNILENTTESFKHILGKSSKLSEYNIIDKNSISHGSFYTKIDGSFVAQQVICYNNKMYNCYNYALGKVYVFCIFDCNHQIAQISKSTDVRDNLDVFYLYLEDNYKDLFPILSFFTIYIDFIKFHRSGKYTKYSVEKCWSYTFNHDKYDSNWIGNTFGENARKQLNVLLGGNSENNVLNSQISKNKAIYISILIAIIFIIVIIIICICFALFLTAYYKTI